VELNSGVVTLYKKTKLTDLTRTLKPLLKVSESMH